MKLLAFILTVAIFCSFANAKNLLTPKFGEERVIRLSSSIVEGGQTAIVDNTTGVIHKVYGADRESALYSMKKNCFYDAVLNFKPKSRSTYDVFVVNVAKIFCVDEKYMSLDRSLKTEIFKTGLLRSTGEMKAEEFGTKLMLKGQEDLNSAYNIAAYTKDLRVLAASLLEPTCYYKATYKITDKEIMVFDLENKPVFCDPTLATSREMRKR